MSDNLTSEQPEMPGRPFAFPADVERFCKMVRRLRDRHPDEDDAELCDWIVPYMPENDIYAWFVVMTLCLGNYN
jgi:hypothetical protein